MKEGGGIFEYVICLFSVLADNISFRVAVMIVSCCRSTKFKVVYSSCFIASLSL